MISHEDKMASLSPERRAGIQARAEQALKELRAIRELRSHLGLTQEELAESVGESIEISQSRISYTSRSRSRSSYGNVSSMRIVSRQGMNSLPRRILLQLYSK